MSTSIEQVFAQARDGKLHAGNLIPGHNSANAARLENRTPIDNTLIGWLEAGTAADVDSAVLAARTSFESGEWSGLSPAQRKTILLRWADRL